MICKDLLLVFKFAYLKSKRNLIKFSLLIYIFQNIDDWSFDVFGVNDTGEGHALKYVGYELLQRYDVITKFKVKHP